MSVPILIASVYDGPKNTGDAPVHVLHIDILLSIFTLNADMFAKNENALKTTRLTSQVCQSWRHIILQSTWLWGRLIDLDNTYRASNLWREEILRRSGNSLLWIKAFRYIKAPTNNHREFFLSVLDKHWDRIAKLDIEVDTVVIRGGMEEAWHKLCCPAPRLRYFHVEVIGLTVGVEKILANAPLFANNAPYLDHFCFKRVEFNILNGPTWLSGLRSIYLGDRTSRFDTLAALQMTTRLEYLSLRDSCFDGHAQLSSFTQVDLTSLRGIDIFASLDSCLFFLNHIAFPPGCSFRFSVSSFAERELFDGCQLPVFKPLMQHLASHAQRLFDLDPPQILTLDFSHGQSSITDSLTYGSNLQKARFGFSIPMLYNDIINNGIILSEFYLPSLDKVNQLRFRSPFSVTPLLKTQILHLFLCFPAVEILETDALQAIMENQSEAKGSPFPLLKILKIQLGIPSVEHDEEESILADFVHSRQRDGYPNVSVDLIPKQKTFNSV